jgi:hypothetical protein
MKSFVALFVSLFFACGLCAQENFYAIDTIQDIEITFTQSNWDYQMDTAYTGSEGYILASQVSINGIVYDSVGVKYKGNSTYNASQTKNPFHIKLDYVHGSADYDNVTDIKLSNCFADPSMVREVLAYQVLRNYMAAPLCNFARVSVNGLYLGVYSNAQSVDSDFLSDNFYSSDNTFFKCNPQSVVSGQLPSLIYLGTDSSNYYSRYEIKSDYAWKDLIDMCDTLNNYSAYADTLLDIDRVLWMLAFNNVTVNLDSYTGAFAQNYYLYKDDNGQFDPVIWDLNMCFGGFQNTGSGILTLSGMQQMSPLLHSANGARPLISKLLADTTYKRMYIAHMRTITNEYFANSLYVTMAQDLQTMIDSSVQAETFSFYTYAQFQSSMSTATGAVPGITTLMSARATYLAGTTQFQAVPPVITNVAATPSVPAINDTVWMTANITGAGTVWLGYRDQLYKNFTRVNMYDDGAHQDGTAGDGMYGIYILATSGQMQYYVYAENVNAGIFSPERAEYEFYSLQVAVSTAGIGQVVINEFLAINQADATDENGQHEDWIELFNRTGMPLQLFGLYLTDDYANPLKFALPDLIIPANGYLIIWADEDNTTSSYVHCNFKLSSAGEQLMLSTASGVVIDSITFAAQTADVSLGRCPNGTGSFTAFSPATFNALNACPASVDENQSVYVTRVYPNPANEKATFLCPDPDAEEIVLYDLNGREITSAYFENGSAAVETFPLAPGIYIYRIRTKAGEKIYTGKVSVTH